MAEPAGFFSRESTIRRDARGRWFHDGVVVENEAIARAFDRWLTLGPDGRYRLENSINWVYVEIEGAPIFVKAARADERGVALELSDGTTELLVADSLAVDGEGVLACRVRGGTLDASFTRKAQAMMADIVGEDAGGIYVEIAGKRVRPIAKR